MTNEFAIAVLTKLVYASDSPDCIEAVAMAQAALRSPAPGAEAMREAAAKVAEGGRFLHDDSPEARWGKACAAAIRALPLPAPEVPDHWTATKDAMPEKSRGFLAFCQGFKEHSGVTWRRTGFAFMAWHPPGWSEQHMKDARKQLDADSLEVTHWMYLTEPKEIV